MNRVRVLLIAALLATISLTGGWFWLTRRMDQTSRGPGLADDPPFGHTQITAAAEFAISNQPSVTPEDAALPPGMSPSILKQMAHARRRFTEMNGPVAFFGRVIDQRGEPVVDARIRLKLSRYSDRLLDTLRYETLVKEDEVSTASDTSGRFNVTGRHGSTLRIEVIEREGYLWENPGFGSFDYQTNSVSVARPYADPAKGVTFHMWKKGATEQVVLDKKVIRLREHDGDYPINLFMPANSVSGESAADLWIRLRFTSPNDPQNKYDQQLILEVPNGGIVESVDPYLFLAPSNGYSARIEYRVTPQDLTGGNWRKKYYLVCRGRKIYASLDARFTLFPYALQFDFVVNPHGSRNLEPDPVKQITDPEEIRRLEVETSR